MAEKINYAELRRTLRDMHDYIKHPEREVPADNFGQSVALACLPHPMLLAEQLVREHELRIKAERIWYARMDFIEAGLKFLSDFIACRHNRKNMIAELAEEAE